MTTRWRGTLVLLLALVATPVRGQERPLAPAGTAEAEADRDAVSSRLWLLAGAAFASLRGDCQTCETDYPYRQGTALLVGGGYRVNSRMEVGGEVLWLPLEYVAGERIHTTHVDAVARFRPWASKGFIVKGGAGMAFVRNWVDVRGVQPFNSKALSVVIGGGWAFRPAARVGVEVFATQHAAAVGDFEAPMGKVEDVIGNFWSVGAAITFR